VDARRGRRIRSGDSARRALENLLNSISILYSYLRLWSLHDQARMNPDSSSRHRASVVASLNRTRPFQGFPADS